MIASGSNQAGVHIIVCGHDFIGKLQWIEVLVERLSVSCHPSRSYLYVKCFAIKIGKGKTEILHWYISAQHTHTKNLLKNSKFQGYKTVFLSLVAYKHRLTHHIRAKPSIIIGSALTATVLNPLRTLGSISYTCKM